MAAGVHILGLLLALAVAAPALAEQEQPTRFPPSTTAAAWRLALPSQPGLTLRFSPIASTLEILDRAGKPVRGQLPGLSATPCRLAGEPGLLKFVCSTGRLEAAIGELGPRRFLDLRELRGLPTAEGPEGPHAGPYPPEQHGLGAACPGDSPASRGECALQAGHLDLARLELLKAFGQRETRHFAALRLGDLALRRGDPDEALARYGRAVGQGDWGRLALERICELTGQCLGSADLEVYDPAGLPPALRRELELRKVRTLALLRRWDEVVALLPSLMADGGACESSEDPLCRRILVQATQEQSGLAAPAAWRLDLPSLRGLTLRFSPIAATVEVLARDGKTLRAQLPGLEATPCRPEGDPGLVKLVCTTGRLEAAIGELGPRLFLDLRLLRGLPTDEGPEGPPAGPYAPEQLGLGGACPGDTPASRGECAYQAGDFEAAHAELLAALGNRETRRFAALRLGDLALRRGNPDEALARYGWAAGEGPWARLAVERTCELTGQCLAEDDLEVYDPSGLPVPLRHELELRLLRMLTLTRRWADVASYLPLLMGSGGACEPLDAPLCRRILLQVMTEEGAPAAQALGAYLWMPDRNRGPLTGPLARAAAELAAGLGAPAYAAAILTATSSEAKGPALAAHLQRNIELYVEANDPVRAEVIAAFARTRFPTLGEWPVPARPAGPDPQAQSAPEPDHAAAMLVVARSTLLRAKALRRAAGK